jgi:hypothetical protein
VTFIWIVINLLLGGLCYCDFAAAPFIGGFLLIAWNTLMTMATFNCGPLPAFAIVVVVFGLLWGTLRMLGVDDEPASTNDMPVVTFAFGT